MTQGIKASKGSVQIVNNNGRIKLRWSYAGQRYNFSIGLAYTPENVKLAEAKAKEIEKDIAYERFDPSLNKYRGESHLSIVSTPPPKAAIELKELWSKYLEYKLPSASPKTVDGTYNPVTSYLGKIKTNGLTDALKFRMELLQVTTQSQAKRALMQLNAACKWGLKHKLIEHNPFDGMYLELEAKKSVPPKAFSPEERDQIIEAFKNDKRKGMNYRHYAPFVEFLFLTGCRPCEAIGLRWKNVTPDCSRIHFCESIVEVSGKLVRRPITKTGENRWFTCGERLQVVLRSVKPETITDETLVFPPPKGKAIGLSNFNDRGWTTILTELNLKVKDGVEMTVYNCRDTFITLQAYAGNSSTRIAKWVGNSSEVIEKKYLDRIKLEQIMPTEI